MFSWKHFSWRKWLLLVVLLFVFTFLLAYLVGMTNETKQELFTAASLMRRLAIAVGLGLFLSFMDTGEQEIMEEYNHEVRITKTTSYFVLGNSYLPHPSHPPSRISLQTRNFAV